MGHCHFMAWHTLRDALKMTGRSRSQFYRDMRSGLVSYRTGRDGRREFETCEPRQPGGCKLKTGPVRPVVAARPADYVCSEDPFY
ncbi:entry exclusion protein 1 [Escherichia coli]|nr:entry exclusion protein 1 [Escherichia coli]